MNSSTAPGEVSIAVDEAVLQRIRREPRVSSASADRQAAATLRPQFTGDGGEYFRIWVVNTLLTLLTLGLYSAWAKVRKTRYFWQNTRLDGHVFDFHGNPMAILRGRLLALALLLAYSWGFEISVTAGLLTVALLCLAGPWLFMRAQQFKLRNTSHRGLRFDFDADPPTSYRALLPLLLIWFSGTVAGALLAEHITVLGMLALGTVALFPWMHHRLKQFQHSHALYGNIASSFVPATRRFYILYIKGVLVLVVASIVGSASAMALVALATTGASGAEWAGAAVGYAAVAGGALAYLFVWAYFAARVQQVVWRNTCLGRLEFDTHIRGGTYAGLVLRCVLLTLLTLGLYWPYAAVSLARYRVQCMEVRHAASAGRLAAGIQRKRTSAAGDGALDLFGLDIGL